MGTVWPMRRSLRRWGQPLIAAPFIGSAAWATWNGLVACDVSSAVETACDSARLYALPWPDVPDLGLSASPVCGVCDQAAARPFHLRREGLRAGRVPDVPDIERRIRSGR